jgi:hypothetical protein
MCRLVLRRIAHAFRRASVAMMLSIPPHSVSFRLFHPSIRPEEISSKFKLDPYVCWGTEDVRKTPKGLVLPGHRDSTYWCSPNLNRCANVLDTIESILSRFEVVSDWLGEFHASGGRSEIYLWLVGTVNQGETFPATLLSRFGALGVELSMEVLTVEQEP